MAIATETFYIDGREFTKTYSDAGRGVVRDGIQYTEACDPAEFGRVYTEGDILPTDDGISDKAEAFDILTGVSE